MRPNVRYAWLSLICLLYKLNTCAAVDISSTRVCVGTATRLYNQSDVPGTTLVEWDLNNDGLFDDATGDSTDKVFALADSFEVRIKITDSTGAEFFSPYHLVIVDPVPVTAFTISDTCFGQTTHFTNHSTISDASTLSYEWDIDNNGSIDAFTQNTIKLYNTASAYNTKLTAVSDQGCRNSLAESFSIYNLPVPAFSYYIACAKTNTVLVNQSATGSGTMAQVVWYFGDDGLGFQTDTAYHRYQTADSFNVKLVIINSYGCVDSISKGFVVPASIAYNYAFSNGQTIEAGSSTDVTLTGDYTSLTWLDNSLSTNPRTLTDSGYYAFKVANAAGCATTDSFLIQENGVVITDTSLKAGNDFLTPNADGVNDVLAFKNISYYSNCQLQVYDTRGFEVYKATSYSNDWNGEKSGKPLNAGAYYYFLKCDGQQEIKGTTNIIR